METRVRMGGKRACPNVILETSFSDLCYAAANGDRFIIPIELYVFYNKSMIGLIDLDSVERIAIPLCDDDHCWTLVIFIKPQAVEVLDTICYEMGDRLALECRRFRDKMSLVAIFGVVEYLSANNVRFRFENPTLRISEPGSVVSQTDLTSTALYTLMYLEEWTAKRPILTLPRKCNKDLRKWFLHRWIQEGNTNRMCEKVKRKIKDFVQQGQ